MNKQLLVAAIALMAAIPAAYASTDVSSVVGTTTFVEVDAEGLAAVAGLVRNDVTWLDGTTTLFTSQADAADDLAIIAVPDGAASPLDETLTATGVTYTFTDANDAGVSWTTTEYTYSGGFAYAVPVDDVITDALAGNSDEYNFVVMVNTAADHLDATALDLFVFDGSL